MWLFGDLRTAIVTAVVGWLLSTAGIYKLKCMLQTPIELWLVIVIGLSILFGCLILFLIYSYKRKPYYKTDLIQAKDFKWKTTHSKNAVLHVDDIPYCPKHDLRLTRLGDSYYCTEENCDVSLHITAFPKLHEIAQNHIERTVRNK